MLVAAVAAIIGTIVFIIHTITLGDIDKQYKPEMQKKDWQKYVT